MYFKNERGATAAEYALILAMIAAVIVGSLTVLGNNIGTTVNFVGNAISTAT